MRKHWIDNLRWVTVLLVLFYHVFYFYNNKGVILKKCVNNCEKWISSDKTYLVRFGIKMLKDYFSVVDYNE